MFHLRLIVKNSLNFPMDTDFIIQFHNVYSHGFFFDRNSRSKDLLQKLHCNKLKIWMSWHFLNWFAWIRNVDDDVVVEKCIEKDAQWKASNGTNLFQDQLKSSLCLYLSVCVCMCAVVNCEIAFINSMRIGNCGGCFSIYFIYLVPVVY